MVTCKLMYSQLGIAGNKCNFSKCNNLFKTNDKGFSDVEFSVIKLVKQTDLAGETSFLTNLQCKPNVFRGMMRVVWTTFQPTCALCATPSFTNGRVEPRLWCSLCYSFNSNRWLIVDWNCRASSLAVCNGDNCNEWMCQDAIL